LHNGLPILHNGLPFQKYKALLVEGQF